MTGPGTAAEMVKLPATLLMVAGGIGIAMQLLAVVINIAGIGMGAAAEGAGDQQPLMIAQGVGGIVGGIIGLAFSGVVIFGALKMKQLQSYPMALTSSILAMLPCISCGCLLGLPVGIWSLVILNKPEVKSAFR
jgi:hypothetical protein